MSDSTLFKNSAAFERLIDLVPRTCSIYEAKFQKSLTRIPTPGFGRGCHKALLGIATLGFWAGHTEDEILATMKAAIPAGGRTVTDKEIKDAIKRAKLDTVPAGSALFMRPSVEIERRKKLSEVEAARVRERVLSYRNGPVELDSDAFREAHGFQLEPQPMAELYPEAFTMNQLLGTLFAPDDPLYIGAERMQNSGIGNIRTAAEWIEFFDVQQKVILDRVGNTDWNSSTPSAFLLNLGMRYSHIVPNPVTGCFGKTKGGTDSLRCDSSIRDFRYAVIDFDGYDTIEEQGEVLHCLCAAMDIRICALIHTGGRGYHAWVRVNGAETLKDWNKIVRDGLFPTFEALGADPACFNPSRSSRLPGVYRWGADRWQRLLLVNREGVKI